jgi:tetratricopeptide (TPR) repeat protein
MAEDSGIRKQGRKTMVASQHSGASLPAALKISVTLCLIALATLPATCQQEGLTIQGQVLRGDGGPFPSDVTVRLEEAEGVEIAKQFVGIDGKFEFSYLKEKSYRLVVTAKGFQTVIQDIDMHYLASRFPRIYLLPPNQKESVSASSPTVSASDLAASKKARKEYEKGHDALQSGNYDKAREYLEKAIAEYPCFARAYASLGVVLSMQRQFGPAELSLQKSIKCDAGFLEAYVQLAILLNIQRKFSENEPGIQEGLHHFSDAWQLYYQLGIAERGLGKLDQAEQAYLKAQSINAAMPPEFHVKLADVYLREKQYVKAYAEMQTYLKADPGGSYVDETKSLMKRLESSGMLTNAPDKPGDAPQ